MGIYLDESTSDCEVAYNYINYAVWKIYSHYCMGNEIHHNTIVNGNTSPAMLFNIDQAGDINNNVHDNLTVNIVSSPSCVQILGNITGKVQTFSNNKYFYPLGKSAQAMFAISGITGGGGAYLTLAEWKADDSRSNWNRGSEAELTALVWTGPKPQLNFVYYLTNPAKTVRTVQAAELPYSDYLDMDGVPMSYPFTIPAYGSKVLVRPN
jgi:hypothetical protein